MSVAEEGVWLSETASEGKEGVLDRPIFGGTKITWWTLLYAALMLFIVFTRFWDLGARGYSHDESIHAWESWKLVSGQGYSHNPVYHGPLLYHLTSLVFALFGHTDVTGRLATSFAGVLITLAPLFMQRWLGRKGVLVATLLMAISPVMMARARFIRHDQWAIVANLALLIAALYYMTRPKTKYLFWASGALSLGFCAKETTFITYFIFGTFLAGLFVYQWLRHRGRPLADFAVFDLLVVMGTLILPTATPFLIKALGGDPIDYGKQGILFSGAVYLAVLAVSVAIGLWWNWRRWLTCAAIFYLVFVPLFTTMFSNGQGFATGMVGQLGYWLSQQEVKRGGQPWYYYLVLMPMYEFLPLLAGVGGTVYYFLRGDPRATAAEAESESGPVLEAPLAPVVSLVPVVPLLIYWAFMTFVLYSWAGEKMPWLTLHLALPLQLLAAWAIARLLDADWARVRAKQGLWLLLLIPLFIYSLSRPLVLKPSLGTTTQELSSTMGWLMALIVSLILLFVLWRIARSLRRKDMWRMIALSLLVFLAALTIRFAWMVTFTNAGIVSEFLFYAQGTPDDATVARELETLSRRLTGGLHMKVAYDDEVSWPFVWYLRNFDNAQFYAKKPAGPFDAEVVLVGSANEAGVKPFLGNNYYRRQYRLIWWPNQDWYMNLSARKLYNDLKDPVSREKLWNVIFYRKHEASLTAWPFVNNFAMYVRRDVVRQLWDYGPEALTAAAALPGDEYIDRWQPMPADLIWGGVGSGSGQFQGPRNVDVDGEGNLYVADTYNHRIQVLDADGQFLRQWGTEGTLPGQFKEPWGIAVAPDGDVYVADTWNHRIQVFSSEGALKRTWGVFGEASQPRTSPQMLYGPRDVAIGRQGFVYVSDTGNKRVMKLDPQGQMIAAAGGLGEGDGQLQEPVGLALDSEGNLYVADTWNRRIQVFDSQMNYLRQWPIYAWDGMSLVNKPYLAFDAQDQIYATDPEGFRVLKFDVEGKLLRSWGQFGSDTISLNLPTGIVVDALGRVLVTDSENHRISLFSNP